MLGPFLHIVELGISNIVISDQIGQTPLYMIIFCFSICLKVGIILVLVIMSILTPSLTYGADSNFEFGTRFIPTKLVEDKEGMIHIFAKKGTSLVPEKIPGLTVTSLDSKNKAC